MAAILDFCSARFYLLLIYKSPWCFLASLESTGLSVQEKMQKIDFHDGGHLAFPIGTIWAIFDLQVILMLPSKFRVNWPFGSGEEAKNRFSRWQHWWHLGFPIGTILAIFDLQVTPMLPTKYQLAKGCRRSRPLKQLLTLHDGRRTLTDHNSSPWALRTQVS